MYSLEIMKFIRSTNATVRTLCPVISANQGGHVYAPDFFNGVAADSSNAPSTLVIVVEGDMDRHTDPATGKTRIEMMGATVVIVPRAHRSNLDEIATLLVPYGDFVAPEKKDAA